MTTERQKVRFVPPRWILGLCLGIGVALILSGTAKYLVGISSKRSLVGQPQPKATRPQPFRDAIDIPQDDPASPADRDLAREFSRALQHRDGVDVSRTVHNSDDSRR